MKISAIDLFCGIGGLSYGFKQEGIEILAGFDSDSSCKFAFEANVESASGPEGKHRLRAPLGLGVETKREAVYPACSG
jgi:site-specific DNA-cytosine methylase